MTTTNMAKGHILGCIYMQCLIGRKKDFYNFMTEANIEQYFSKTTKEANSRASSETQIYEYFRGQPLNGLNHMPLSSFA